MNQTAMKVVSAIPGIPMLLMGLGLLVQPELVVNNLGMPLLTGAALSTQLGDMTSFFLCTGIFIFMGAFHAAPRWLYAGAGLLITVAFARTLAWLVHGAELSIEPITVEVISTIWLVLCAKRLAKT